MEKLRILFMGTPLFAVTILDKLVQKKLTISGVVTAPDKPAGRGRKLHRSAVKTYALEKNLTILQPTNLKSEEFIQRLQGLDINLIIVVAFRMLPKKVWKLPKHGTFNLHASLLPNYRGAAPINWAIINGEQKTGNTTFFIDDKIDTGHIIAQQETVIEPNENAGSLHDRLMNQGANLVYETVNSIAQGKVKALPQPNNSDLKTAYKLTKENTKIDWNQQTKTVYNLIRGLNPYPNAWCELLNNNQISKVKIHQTTMELQAHEMEPGTIQIINSKPRVATLDGFLTIEKLQLPGKRAMDSKSLCNGYTFEKNAKMR